MSAALNLIPIPRIAARQRRAAVRLWLAIGACVAVALLGATIFVQMRWGGEPADLAMTLEQFEQKVSQQQAQLVRLDAELTGVHRRLEANRAVTHQPDYAVLLALFAQHLDEHVLLRSCAFEPMPLGLQTTGSDPARASGKDALKSGFPILVTGIAANQRAVSGYVLRLEQTGLFERVRLINTRREPATWGDGQAIAFDIECFLATGQADGDGAVAQGGGVR